MNAIVTKTVIEFHDSVFEDRQILRRFAANVYEQDKNIWKCPLTIMSFETLKLINIPYKY